MSLAPRSLQRCGHRRFGPCSRAQGEKKSPKMSYIILFNPQKQKLFVRPPKSNPSRRETPRGSTCGRGGVARETRAPVLGSCNEGARGPWSRSRITKVVADTTKKGRTGRGRGKASESRKTRALTRVPACVASAATLRHTYLTVAEDARCPSHRERTEGGHAREDESRVVGRAPGALAGFVAGSSSVDSAVGGARVGYRSRRLRRIRGDESDAQWQVDAELSHGVAWGILRSAPPPKISVTGSSPRSC